MYSYMKRISTTLFQVESSSRHSLRFRSFSNESSLDCQLLNMEVENGECKPTVLIKNTWDPL